MSSPITIYTIGHSTHTIDKFLDLLERNGVTALADVRSSPFSRHNPQFNKDVLSAELKKRGVAYVFVGKELALDQTTSPVTKAARSAMVA